MKFSEEQFARIYGGLQVYAKQDNHTSCGPTAIGNALKFLGIASYAEKENEIKKLCKYKPAEGVWLKYIDKAGRKLAKKYKFTFKKVHKPTFDKMHNSIIDGYGLIVSYNWVDGGGGHIVFIFGANSDHRSPKLATANDSVVDFYESSLEHRMVPRRIWKSRLNRGGFACWKVKRINV